MSEQKAVPEIPEELSWKPITPENMPQVGVDEVGRWRLESHTWLVCDVADTPWKGSATVKQYNALGWKHFRPITPPASEKEGR